MKKLKKLANALYVYDETNRSVAGEKEHPDSRLGNETQGGGLWVGGSVIVSDDGVSFSANALNRKLHMGIPDVSISRSAISSVQYRFGWFTGIVEVQFEGGVFIFRCYGAKRLVAQFNGE